MKKFTLSKTSKLVLVLSAVLFSNSAFAHGCSRSGDNELVTTKFWENATLETVKASVAKGNDPLEIASGGFSPLLCALNKGASLEVIKYLVEEKGANVDEKGHHDIGALGWATWGSTQEVFEYLKTKSKLAPKDVVDASYGSLLNVAIKNRKDVEFIDFLLKQDVDPKAIDKKGNTIGVRAGAAKTLAIAKKVAELSDINAVNDKGEGAIHNAGENENLEVVKFIFNSVEDPNLQSDEGETVLHEAVGNDNIEVFKWLLENVSKETINAVDEDGNTALHKSVKGGHGRVSENAPQVIDLLIAKGLDPKQVNKDGRDLLSMAAKSGSKELLGKIIGLGLDVNKTDKDGRTPLMHAAEKNKVTSVEFLLSKGSDINATDNDGNTALMLAVRKNKVDVVKFLLEKGAKINALNNAGSNALIDITMRTGRGTDGIFDLLIEKGAKADVKTKKGLTSLIAASKKGADIKVLEMLIKKGVDVNAVDCDKMTALMYLALKGKDAKAIKLLLDNGAKTDFADDFDETAYDMILENKNLKDSDAVKLLKK